MSIQLEVWGDYALFTRPEMKVERVSYDIMTPSAARAIIASVMVGTTGKFISATHMGIISKPSFGLAGAMTWAPTLS